MDTGSGSTKVEEKEELKAVVLADTFDELFQPMTQNRPRSLLPLCNVPMIEYTLEMLALSGVVEAFIMCKAHADKLTAYIKQSQWARGHAQMKVFVRTVRHATTIGDALRAVDESSAIMTDFILCTGIVVSNMNLSKIVAAHVANKKRDGNHIMTMLLQETTPGHRRQVKSDESVYFIDPSSSRLLALNSHAAVPRVRTTVIQPEVITAHAEVEVRADLTDTCVAICTPDVLALFTENFDYHIMRRDFIHGILESDILGKTIYAHVLGGSSSITGDADGELLAGEGLAFVSHSGYAACVTDTAAYDAISRDLIGRWAYPLCPDNNPGSYEAYSYSRGAVYKASSVRLDRESRVEHHVILGADSRVAGQASIADSVLGARCSIGENSAVRGSHLFGDVRVGRNAVIEGSVLGERVTVLDNVVIERGCLIGDDVTVGPNVRVSAFTRIARRRMRRKIGSPESMHDDDSDDDEENTWADAERTESDPLDGLDQFDRQAVGAEGVGYVWGNATADAGSDADSDYSDDDTDQRLRHLHTLGSTMADAAYPESDGEGSADEDDDEDNELAHLSPQEEFERELYLTIKRACDDNLSASKASLELKSLRMSYNKEQDEMRAGVVQEVLRTIDMDALADSASRTLRRWGPVIAEYIGDGRDQLDLVDILERHCALEHGLVDATRTRLFVRLVYLMYQLDIVEDVAIIAWHNRAQKRAGEVNQELVRALEPVVDGLNESDDESDEDSGSDDETDDGSDESE
ncbi:translation initiation factor eIF-2B epsilon subunit, GEF [Coemansia sp. RSA 1822]|nr:translation initiation factor eIF-2B epsilon subunit, GEF [Coemansia sp. RSA 720]KAJ2545237.1 translation initiation factor eIF-2B epsilon subunit, GEF [Coemansia sp. RSA 1853]KAJ2566951.1 translation initiation factor eIF-2B epsilon subunit, GEF [Coemansia sp. RSA 1822]